MKIGIISDSHGDFDSFKIAVENILNDCELIIHAGDILNHGPRNKIPTGYNPLKLAEEINNLSIDIMFAKGNCDSDVDQMLINNLIASPYLYLCIEDFKIFVHHGDKNIEQKFFKNIDIYISGHTHIFNLEHKGSTIYLNPGSLSLPKKHSNGTCAVIDTTLNKIFIFDIINRKNLIEIYV